MQKNWLVLNLLFLGHLSSKDLLSKLGSLNFGMSLEIRFEGMSLGSFFNPSKKSRKVESNKTVKIIYFINEIVKI